MQQYVRDRLQNLWSPEQIAQRSRLEFPRQPARWLLSDQTIYNWIDQCAPEWRGWLRQRGRPPERRGKLVDCVRIDDRPEVINRRPRYGDWEGDTMVGQVRRSPLVTLGDRKSGYARIGRADDMTAATTRVLMRRMRDLPPLAATERNV